MIKLNKKQKATIQLADSRIIRENVMIENNVNDIAVSKINLKFKHGMTKSRIYRIFVEIKRRCLNKNCKDYKNYGGRGIIICDEWLNKENGFMNFYNWAMINGYQNDLTIDRVNNNGNYEPSNCRWITSAEQNRNQRSNRLITYNGETKIIAEWARILNINKNTILSRLRYNWSIEDTFKKPIRK